MNSKRTLFFIEIAIFTALALVLDNIPFLKFKVWANGGSVSFAMIPVFIVAFRWGIKGGLLSGLLWGLLKIAFGGIILTLHQGFVEYGLAFTVLGFAGLFSAPLQQAIKNSKMKLGFMYVMLGVLLGAGLRYLAHVYAGIVFWGEFTPEGWPVVAWSIVYNGSYMLPSFILCTIAIYYLFYKQPRTLLSATQK